jgi:hypothetical protein
MVAPASDQIERCPELTDGHVELAEVDDRLQQLQNQLNETQEKDELLDVARDIVLS